MEGLLYKDKIYVSNSQGMKFFVMSEMHIVPYIGHPGYQKTILVARKQYFWLGMKKEVANYIAKFLEFQKAKVEHRHPMRLLQPIPIPKWKREIISIFFITTMPRTVKQHDSIKVMVDKLTQVCHLIPMKSTHKVDNFFIYLNEGNF